VFWAELSDQEYSLDDSVTLLTFSLGLPVATIGK
jgi:hypothetical protein